MFSSDHADIFACIPEPITGSGEEAPFAVNYEELLRMKTLEEIKQIIEDHREVCRHQYHVKGLSVFGSYVKKEQKESSDLDILVEFEKPISLLQLVSLENYLSDILGLKVDLVPKNNLREELKVSILKEAISI